MGGGGGGGGAGGGVGVLSVKNILNKLLGQYLCHQVEDNAEEKHHERVRAKSEKVATGNILCLEDETLYFSSAEKYASLVTQHSRLCRLDFQLVSVTKTGRADSQISV